MGSDAKSAPDTQNIVLSRTLNPADSPHVVVESDAERVVTDLRAKLTLRAQRVYEKTGTIALEYDVVRT